MRPLVLDDRLYAACELLPKCKTIADIGTDHGRLPAFLLESGQCAYAVLGDISPLALSKAQALFQRRSLTDKAAFFPYGGLAPLKACSAEAVAILGMGGDTLCTILREGAHLLHGAVLVVSPHTDLPETRKAIMDIGYHLTKEKIVSAGKRMYVLMRAESGAAVYTDMQLSLGPCLMENHPPLYKEYLLWRKKVLEAMTGGLTQDQLQAPGMAQKCEMLHFVCTELAEMEITAFTNL